MAGVTAGACCVLQPQHSQAGTLLLSREIIADVWQQQLPDKCDCRAHALARSSCAILHASEGLYVNVGKQDSCASEVNQAVAVVHVPVVLMQHSSIMQTLVHTVCFLPGLAFNLTAAAAAPRTAAALTDVYVHGGLLCVHELAIMHGSRLTVLDGA